MLKTFLNKYICKEANIIIWLNHDSGYYYNKKGDKFNFNIYDPYRNYKMAAAYYKSNDMYILKSVRSLHYPDVVKYIKDYPYGHGFRLGMEIKRRWFIYYAKYIRLVPAQFRLTTRNLDIPIEYIEKLSVDEGKEELQKLKKYNNDKNILIYKKDIEYFTSILSSNNTSIYQKPVLERYIQLLYEEIKRTENDI